MILIFFAGFIIAYTNAAGSSLSTSVLDNGVVGDPQVDCMEDRVKLTFRTEKPFNGRIFVKGMIENDKCVQNFVPSGSSSNSNNNNNNNGNNRPGAEFEIMNGDCNMRRSRKISPEERGIEQSITIIISFHNTFITKVDRAYRCTCFYMEADKVVTSKLDVSEIPTTDLIDTAKMPLCTYSVRRGSVNGAIVNYATVGEPLFHVWQCESDMFSMLVHSCFVDSDGGNDKKPLLDEHGCSIDTSIIPDLSYNQAANLAYTEVNAFKFADKVTTYFQCAVSTCMIAEGMCNGKTPPRCTGAGASAFNGFKRVRRSPYAAVTVSNFTASDPVAKSPFDFTMDLSADKIIVFDLDDLKADSEAAALTVHQRIENAIRASSTSTFPSTTDISDSLYYSSGGICLSQESILTFIAFLAILMIFGCAFIAYFFLRLRSRPQFKI